MMDTIPMNHASPGEQELADAAEVCSSTRTVGQRQPTSKRIMQLINGYWATGIPGVAASHSLFTHLQTGAHTASQLAARAGISRRGAQTLLDGRVRVGAGELCDGSYRNTAEAATFLVVRQPACLGSVTPVMLTHPCMLH